MSEQDARRRRGGPVARGVAVAVAVILVIAAVVFIVGLSTGKTTHELTHATTPSEVSPSSEVAADRSLAQRQPSNTGAWERLTRALLQEQTAGGSAYVTSAGTPTTAGKTLLSQAAEAWSRYLAMTPPKPSPELAGEMASVYGESGLNEPAQAVTALQLALAAHPTDAALYAELAEYAYKANEPNVGEAAAEKAVAVAPPSQQVHLREELATLKSSHGSAASETYTTTTDGKTYVGKLNSKGELKATEVKTATAP